MLMMRALIRASGTPWKGGVGQNSAHDAFRGGGLGHWKSSPVVGRAPGKKLRSDGAGSAARPFVP